MSSIWQRWMVTITHGRLWQPKLSSQDLSPTVLRADDDTNGVSTNQNNRLRDAWRNIGGFLANILACNKKLGGRNFAWRRPFVSSVLVIFFLLSLLVYHIGPKKLLLLYPLQNSKKTFNDMVLISRPTFNCSDLHLKVDKPIVAEQHYHTFPSNVGGRNLILSKLCQSKYQQHCFRKNTGPEHFPPPKFMQLLRDYELYHAKCTNVENLTALAIKGETPEGCKYLVWKSLDGMGNQLLSLVCAFVYSLLTNRAMLIATDSHIDKYICNPFPLSSWILPADFPEKELRTRSAKRVYTYLEETLQKVHQGKSCNTIPPADIPSFISQAPKHLHAYIICCDARRDHQFFCPTAQKLFSGVNWLFYLSHEYTLPGFYFIPEFREKLNQWFPHRNVFMHASRYLLNPENGLWAEISKLYKTHMDGVDKQIGIQPRSWKGDYNPSISRQIQRCVVDQKLLPKPLEGGQVNTTEALDRQYYRHTDISVLVTSLRGEYESNLHLQYVNHPNADGLHVNVFSVSHEGWQKTGDATHDAKAIIDIWLLSFTHDLVITPFSTFGTMATGLAGKTPLVFINYGQDKVHEAACGRTNSAGPCFIVFPINQACDLDPARSSIFDPSNKVPEVKYCNFNPGLGIESM